VLDALVYRQDRQIAGSSQPPVPEHLLQAAQHGAGAVGLRHYTVHEVRSRQVQQFLGDALAYVAKQLVRVCSQQCGDIGAACRSGCDN